MKIRVAGAAIAAVFALALPAFAGGSSPPGIPYVVPGTSGNVLTSNGAGVWISGTGVATGVIGSGTANQMPYYAGTGTTLTAATVGGDCTFSAGSLTCTTSNGVAIVTTTGSQTLASKTLTAPTVNAATLTGTLAGTPTFSGNLTFSAVPKLTGLSTGTQVSCLGLDSGNNIVLTSTGCGSASGAAFNVISSGTNTSAAMVIGAGASLAPASTGTITATAFNSTSNNGNTLVGTAAGASLGASESLVTAVGYKALNANSLNGTAESTAVGWSSQAKITTGSQNTTIGVNTLGNCLVCIHDMAFGTDSMRNTISGQGASSQSGQYNIGIGVTTMANTNTWQSIAIGESAQQGPVAINDTSHENISIGWETMIGTSMTSANQNIAIGNSSMPSLTSASGDVCIGYQACLGHTTDFWNTVVGWFAGNSMNGGFANVVLGGQAGQHMTSGNENIIIGYGAGTNNITTGTNNILIGTSVDPSNPSNSIHIGTGGGDILSVTGTGTPGTSAATIAGSLTVAGGLTTNITSAGAQCVQASAAGLLSGSGSACGAGGGSLTVTDGTHSVSSTTTATFANTVVSGSAGSATITPTVVDVTKTASYSAAAGDMGNALTLAATTGTPALTLPTASSTIFAPGMSLTISVPKITSGVNWTVTNSTGLTMRGLNSTTLLPGTSGTFVANNDGATIDFFPSVQVATTTALGSVIPDNSTITITNGVISAATGGSGCTVSGGAGAVFNNGSSACVTDTDLTFATHTITLGASGIIDLSAASTTAGLKLPSAAGAVPTADGIIAVNTTTHALVSGSNGTTIVQAAAATGTGTATTCTNQVITAVSAVAIPTCTTVTGAMIQSSAALAGSPTTTTQSANDNSTKVATTAYVDRPTALPTPGSGATLAAPRSYYVCTTTCTITLPTPAAGYEFCVRNDNNVTTVITFAAIASVQFENTAFTSYKTANTSIVSGGAAGDKLCVLGRDATHYLVASFNGTWS